MITFDLNQFVTELDNAIQAHLEWSRRVFRCAVTITAPGEDVLEENAHTKCRFGQWFYAQRNNFAAIDEHLTVLLEKQHREMHDSIRRICTAILARKCGCCDDLDIFETTQSNLVEYLSFFKTSAVSRNSQIDALTGLPLRHRMEQDFELLTKHTRHRGTIQVVMMIDLDHFKQINDQYGHTIGDMILQYLAATLRKALRADDLIYRYGGEEFLLLLELPTVNYLESTAQRLINEIRDMVLPQPDGDVICITVTIGIAMAIADESLSSIINRADQALYQGKAAGRNRYIIANGA